MMSFNWQLVGFHPETVLSVMALICGISLHAEKRLVSESKTALLPPGFSGSALVEFSLY
jgi:hypothetical protein